MNQHEKLNYLEFPANRIAATKAFFESAFGWSFEDFGSDYTTFSDQGINGGFFKSDKKSTPSTGGALAVFYSDNLEATQAKIKQAGGTITQEIFSFPGGRRFHFSEPSGNELAVWSDQEPAQ